MSVSILIIARASETLGTLVEPVRGMWGAALLSMGGGAIAFSDDGMHCILMQSVQPVVEIPEEAYSTYTRNLGDEVRVFSLGAKDVELTRRILLRIADRRDVLVDLLRGRLLVGGDLVRVLRDWPEWDWRANDGSDPPELTRCVLARVVGNIELESLPAQSSVAPEVVQRP